MSPELTRKALKIFSESHSAENRQLFLDEECGTDPMLRQEIQSLLAAEASVGDFMEEPLLPLSGSFEADLAAGDVIGKYKLVRPLGEGGMGTVYLAEGREPGFQPKVAIKLIRPGRDGEQIISRFLKEHELLSKLHHQNIAKPFDRGTTADGRPYLVMEYVEGQPINRYCDEQKLSTPERLRLFRKVCEAVHFAHQNLIVHRDLKPANILVNPQGEPKLLDFGVAQMVDPSPLSSTAETLRQTTAGFFGTLKYASPEQVRNEDLITTVSDIYSLGILLYELLTGHYPFQKWTDSFLDLVNAICEEEPEKPSTAVGLLEEVRSSDGNQVTVTPEEVSATRRDDPGHLRRRLSGDLDRIVLKALSKRPADRYGSAQELADDIDRHLNGLPISAREPTFSYQLAKFVQRHTGSVVTGAGFLLLIVVFGCTALWLWKREQKARQEVEAALMVSDYLVELFEIRNPGSDGQRIPASQLLDDGIIALEPEMKIAALPEAEKDLQRSQVPTDLPNLLAAFGWAYYGLGINDEAEKWLEESLERRRQAELPEDKDQAVALLRLSAVYGALQQEDRATAMRSQALKVLHDGKVRDLRLAQLLNQMGRLLLHRGDLEAAAEILEESVAMKRHLLGGDDVSVSITLNNLGKIREMLGEYREAEDEYRESLRIKQKIYGEGADELAVAQNNLAVLLTDLGLLEPERREQLWREAEELFQKSLKARLETSPPDDPRIATVLKNRALLLTFRGELEEAESQLDEALKIFRDHFNDNDRAVAETLRHRAVTRLAAGRAEAAEQDARRAAEIFGKAFGAEDWRTADAESIRGECLLDLQRTEEAAPLLESSLPILEAEKGKDARATWEARQRLQRYQSIASGEAAPVDR